MQALAWWKRILLKDFLDLKRLEQQRLFPHVRYSLKEQEIGQHCCQAGEILTDPELACLKQALRVDEQQWHTYRRNVRPKPEEWSE